MSVASNSAETRIAYNGEGVRAGEMNVRDLAPALLGLGEILQSANASLNGGRADVQVYVRSNIRQGSFQVDIDVVQALHHAKTFLDTNKETIKSARDLLTIVGLIGGGTATGVISLIKFIKWAAGRKPDSVKPLGKGETRVTIGNIHIDVKNEVIILAEDHRVRSALSEAFSPLSRPGIDRFEVRENDEVVETVTQDETKWFAPQDLPINADVLHEGDHTAVLEVIKPALVPGKRWTFSDGKRFYGVEMDDKEFLERVARRDVVFVHGDALKVALHTRYARTETGKLVTLVRVTKVIKELPAGPSKQGRLFPPAH